MATIINGKEVSAAVRAQVAQETAALKQRGIVPGLAVIIVGDDPASRVYVNNKKKACAEAGIYSEEFARTIFNTFLIRIKHYIILFYNIKRQKSNRFLSLTPRVGFEPTTLRLTAECSTTELSRNTYIV